MSLYFFSKLNDSAPATVSSHRKLPVSAYAVGNKVVILGEDGLEQSNVQRAASTVSAMAWHPTSAVALIGWQDGNVSVWNSGGRDPQHSGSPQHENSSVVAACWTDNDVVATVSKTGAAVLWQFDGVRLGVLAQARCGSTNVIRSLTALHGTDEKPAEDNLFLAHGNGNEAFLIEESTNCGGAFTLDNDTNIVAALWAPATRHVLVLSSTSSVYQYHLAHDNVFHLTTKQKLSLGPQADATTSAMVWAAPGLAAISSGDECVRFYNVDQENMYVVTAPDPQDVSGGPAQHRITALAGNRRRNALAAATKTGQIFIWSSSGSSNADESDWTISTSMNSTHRMPVEQLQFTPSGSILITQASITSLLQETPRLRAFGAGCVAVQIAPDAAAVLSTSTSSATPNAVYTIRNGSRIKALDVCFPNVVIHNGRSLEVYTLTEGTGAVTQLHSVEQDSPVVAVNTDGFLVSKGDKLALQNLQLHNLAQLGFNEADGAPSFIDVMGSYCVVITTRGQMKVCRISARDVKAVGPTRKLDAIAPEGYVIASARVNARGKKVAMLRKPTSGSKVDSVVYVYDVDTDAVTQFDFSTLGQCPVDLFWNRPTAIGTPAGPTETESLLLAVETSVRRAAAGHGDGAVLDNEASVLDSNGDGGSGDHGANQDQRKVCTLFASPTKGLVVHNTISLSRDTVCLVGCCAPNLLLCTASGPAASEHRLDHRRLRDFEGMGNSDEPKLRDALMQFSYCTAIGNMDEAYRVVKTVKDTSVWTNLARMCVVSGRMDVAEVCLANMQDAVGARALREAREQPEPEVAQASLAMSLNMLEECERLLKTSKRNDLLTELYAACGKWDTATRHAETHDRIRIYPTLYRYGQHMEAAGNTEEALRLYTKAKCYGSEGPRLLFSSNRIDELRANVANSDDKELLSWWAQYLESTNDLQGALRCYERIHDGFNQVRLHCALQPPNIDRAIELVADPELPTAKGAAYFVARHFEELRNVQQAMHFYDVAGAFKNALRLAKDNDLATDVVAISLKCGDRHVALESATYFESRGVYEKAAQLYQKGGDSQRAIDVCIKGGLYDELHRISESLDAAADPETFISMAEHFIVSGHHAKAVQMLVFGKAFNEALQLCVDNNVPLTDEMAEAMTLPKTTSQEDEEYRISLLKKIAKVAKAQESWYLACKKYTQAGERVKAMKMLLRSGDTEKIIFFANHSRNAEIYVLAANFLQSQQWQNDTAIYKNIVGFYTKAKAFEQLAGFYDACAQLQVDEYRDYDKALTTLREAQKALDKGNAAAERKEGMRRRAELVEAFVNARGMIKPGEACPQMVEVCNDLLARGRHGHPERDLVESAVRGGDIYALLVEYYDKLGQPQQAYNLIENMQGSGIELTYFLEPSLVEKICNAVGKDPNQLKAGSLSGTRTGVSQPPPVANAQANAADDGADDVGFEIDEEVV